MFNCNCYIKHCNTDAWLFFFFLFSFVDVFFPCWCRLFLFCLHVFVHVSEIKMTNGILRTSFRSYRMCNAAMIAQSSLLLLSFMVHHYQRASYFYFLPPQPLHCIQALRRANIISLIMTITLMYRFLASTVFHFVFFFVSFIFLCCFAFFFCVVFFFFKFFLQPTENTLWVWSTHRW